jgi:hypothetical protein
MGLRLRQASEGKRGYEEVKLRVEGMICRSVIALFRYTRRCEWPSISVITGSGG